jgi:lipopolysaccharide transport system permease protein
MTEVPTTETSPSFSKVLPRGPLIAIRASRSPVLAQLKEAFAHRELLYFFIWRDLKVRYRQTILGAAWVILQPLLTTLVFTIFMSRLARVPSDGLPYPLFAYTALLPWTFFSNSVLTSTYGLTGSSVIITKVYFPRLIIPAAIVGVRLVDFLVASVVLVGLMVWYGISFNRGMLILPLLIANLTIFTLGVSVYLSVLNIKYRDVGTLLPVLLQLWMFASPIIYPISMVPPNWRLLYSLNPIVGMIEAARASVFGLPPSWRSLTISIAVTVVSFVVFVYYFCRSEENLIDIV